MRTLRVWKFSSIIEAELPISQITLLVGPQASGKSVLCKLSYFFCGLLDEQIKAVMEHLTHDAFNEEVRNRFIRWFPAETWGKHRFQITFAFGGCEIQINRTVSQGRPGKSVKVKFCDLLIAHFDQSVTALAVRESKLSDREIPDLAYRTWQIERLFRENLQKQLNADFVWTQLFIPAGRSFFTSVGKAVAAFENSNMLDPITVTFGRIYATRDSYPVYDDPENRPIKALVEKATLDMLGGHLVRERERDREVLKASDGRTIPLSALSSGQQEVFPLLRVLPQFASKEVQRLIYVEEPEAHLFPEAQSKLVSLLAALMNKYGTATNMIITTHSPYVLSKFNNLIYAGQLAKKRSKISAVSAVVPQDSWVGEGQLRAYALSEGRLCEIMDKSGLIDGDYLDSVSNQIAAEFTSLLDIESPVRPV